MKIKNIFTIFTFQFILFLFLAHSVDAQVVINEVLANPDSAISVDEWVELYNTGSSVASLAGCVLYLDGDSETSQKVIFDDGDFVDSVDRFRVITWTNPRLNNTGDQIRLVCPTYSNAVAYGSESGSVVSAPEKEITFGRNPDGSGSFYILSSQTMGEPNSPPPSATPTQTPTNTPIPTNSPTNTPAPSSTPTPKPSATSTPRPTPRPTSKPSDFTEENEKLAQDANVANFRYEDGGGEEDVLGSESEDNNTNKVSPFAYVLFGLGLIFIVISAIFILKGRKNNGNLKDGYS